MILKHQPCDRFVTTEQKRLHGCDRHSDEERRPRDVVGER